MKKKALAFVLVTLSCAAALGVATYLRSQTVETPKEDTLFLAGALFPASATFAPVHAPRLRVPPA